MQLCNINKHHPLQLANKEWCAQLPETIKKQLKTIKNYQKKYQKLWKTNQKLPKTLARVHESELTEVKL